jgi:hypothetical protein
VGEFLNQFGSMTPSPHNSDAPITANSAMPLTLPRRVVRSCRSTVKSGGGQRRTHRASRRGGA